MDIPTIYLSRAEFEALRISPSGAYDQPKCRFKSSTGQWLLIEPGNCAVIEIGTRPSVTRDAFRALERRVS